MGSKSFIILKTKAIIPIKYLDNIFLPAVTTSEAKELCSLVVDKANEIIENDIKIWLGFLINNLHKKWEASFLFKNDKEMLYWELLYKLEYIGLEKNER